MVDILKARDKAKKEKEEGEKPEDQKTSDEETEKDSGKEPEKEESTEEEEKKDSTEQEEKEETSQEKDTPEEEIEIPPEEEIEQTEDEPIEKREEDEDSEDVIEEEDVFELLNFQLSDEIYALSLEKIEEIIEYTSPTDVPNTRECISGVRSLRGRMVTIIDGRVRLGHKYEEPGEETKIIIIRDEGEYVGIVVDEVREVLSVGESEIEEASPVITGVESEYISGVITRNDTLIILLMLSSFIGV